jgi:hypothetical protein
MALTWTQSLSRREGTLGRSEGVERQVRISAPLGPAPSASAWQPGVAAGGSLRRTWSFPAQPPRRVAVPAAGDERVGPERDRRV